MNVKCPFTGRLCPWLRSQVPLICANCGYRK
jgi:hypothetical protein